VRGLLVRHTLATLVAATIAMTVIVLVILVAVGALSLSKGSGTGTSVADIVRMAKPSTVQVNVGQGDQPIASGSGWVLDANHGLIVTNHHVVNAGNQYTVQVGGQQRRARVIGSAPCDDLSVLKVDDTSGLRSMPLGSESDVQQGDTVVALGYPAGAGDNTLSVTSGIVSAVHEKFSIRTLDVPAYSDVIQTTAAINPGNSGGPLIDDKNNLVGVNSAGITDLGGRTIQGEGYAIGVDRVKQVVADLRNGHSRAWTGLGLLSPSDPSQLATLGLPSAQPRLAITNAVPGTPGANAGLGNAPALLIAINGQTMDGSVPTYCNAVDGIKSGDTATLQIIRAGQTTPETVTVGFA
jgi:S1-C subfamily serine protease